MAVPTQEFLTNFHSLTGVTIGERRKNLFLLLKETLKHEEIDFSVLQPKTPLEENLKVEALLYFQRVPELLQVLKNENPILIEKVLSTSSWFVGAAFGGMSGADLMTHVFPHLSYNTKLKLLHQLSLHLRTTSKADEFFAAVNETYGIYLASKLLPGCSSDLIMSCIDSNKVEITARQLLTIIKRHPGLTEDLFEKLNQYRSKLEFGVKYKYVFVYLSQHDHSLFVKLRNKYMPEITLGTRTTDSFIAKERTVIVANPKKFYPLLKKSRYCKRLARGEFKSFFHNLCPKSMNQFNENLDSYLSLLKHMRLPSDKLKLVQETFQLVYGNEIWQHSVFASSSKLIEMMTPDDREIWMKAHARPAEIDEDQWVSFMKTDKSVPLLKERLSFTAKIKDRVKLVGCLISTCKINDDYTALLDVCRYMFGKHRNDHVIVKQQFFQALSESFDLLRLNDEHWESINELMEFCRLKSEQHWSWRTTEDKYILYRLKNDKDVVDLLRRWVKNYGDYSFCQSEPQYEKICLLVSNDLFPSINKQNKLKELYIDYLSALRYWNHRHPEDKISMFINSDAIELLRSRLETEEYAYTQESIALDCIIFDYDQSERTNLIQVMLVRENGYYLRNVISFLLKKHPLRLLAYDKLDTLMKLFYDNKFPKHLFKYYTHLEIPQKLTATCINTINHDDVDEGGDDALTIKNAVICLSYVMKPTDFVNHPALLQSDVAVDITTKQGQHAYKLQTAFLPYLRNTNPPSLALEAILRFCKGDYLNLVQRSLYSTSHNTAENKLGTFFQRLGERAVSVRKHSIFLASKILPKTEVYAMLTTFMKNEQNASIRKSLFKATFNFFMRNPDDYSWQLTTQCVKFLDINDKEAFNILTKCRRIPPRYFYRYVLFTWDVLETSAKPNEVIEEGKCRLLESMTEANIAQMPKEFCEKIMQDYLFKPKELTNLAKKTHGFVSTYLIYHNSSQFEQKQRMSSAFRILEDYIKTTWFAYGTMTLGRRMVADFVENFCSNFIEKKCLDNSVLLAFINSWNEALLPHQALDDYLYLKLTLIYLNCLNESSTMTQIGENLALLCDSLHEDKALVMSVFCQSFGLFKDKFLSTDVDGDRDENELNLIQGVIKGSISPSCLLLAVCLLPDYGSMGSQIEFQYNSIVKGLLKMENTAIRIHLHHYLRAKSE